MPNLSELTMNVSPGEVLRDSKLSVRVRVSYPWRFRARLWCGVLLMRLAYKVIGIGHLDVVEVKEA